MLTNPSTEPFNWDDEYVYFLITTRLCLAALIYVSITLFMAQVFQANSFPLEGAGAVQWNR